MAFFPQIFPIPDSPAIWAHRGYHHAFPENSIGAFRAAKIAGILGVECDIWQIQDGSWVVFHDETMERMTGNPTFITHSTPALLRQYPLYLPPYEQQHHSTEHVPYLIDVLKEVTPFGYCAMELKHNRAAASFASFLRTIWLSADIYTHHLWLCSFDHKALELIRQLAPPIPIALLYETLPNNWDDIRQTINNCRAHALSVAFELITPELIQLATSQQCDLWAWTVNGQQRIAHYHQMGVKICISDHW
jgi:glycerophosphoryl diester phosphodiesterase